MSHSSRGQTANRALKHPAMKVPQKCVDTTIWSNSAKQARLPGCQSLCHLFGRPGSVIIPSTVPRGLFRGLRRFCSGCAALAHGFPSPGRRCGLHGRLNARQGRSIARLWPGAALGCAPPSPHRCPLPCVHDRVSVCAIFSAYTLLGLRGGRYAVAPDNETTILDHVRNPGDSLVCRRSMGAVHAPTPCWEKFPSHG
jgi:hypothetical protein